MKKQIWLIGLYLLAIVLANLSVFFFGVNASILNAFLFIGLDLTARDNLHEVWHKKGLFWKMSLLILSGSIISYLLNQGMLLITIASCVSFLIAGVVDFITYFFMYKWNYLWKSNGSNIFSGATDSIVFPTIAFGGFIWWVTLGQFIAKVIGGFVWSLILKRFVNADIYRK